MLKHDVISRDSRHFHVIYILYKFQFAVLWYSEIYESKSRVRSFCISWDGEINSRYLLFIVWPAGKVHRRECVLCLALESSTYDDRFKPRIEDHRVGSSCVRPTRRQVDSAPGMCTRKRYSCGALWRLARWENAPNASVVRFALLFLNRRRVTRVPTILTQRRRRRLIRADNPHRLSCAFICKLYAAVFRPEFIQASSFAVCIANICTPGFSFSIFTSRAFYSLDSKFCLLFF